MFRLENLGTDIRRLHIQVHVACVMLLLRFLFQFVESVDPVFGFGPASLRLTAHPVQFLAKQVACPVDFRIQSLYAFLTFFQVIAVISFILVNLLPVYFDDLATDTVQEITVVRHHQYANVRTRQVSFEPFGHLQIQVVGRFVEDNQFRIGNQDVCQRHALQLSAGKRFHLLIEILYLQLP